MKTSFISIFLTKEIPTCAKTEHNPKKILGNDILVGIIP